MPSDASVAGSSSHLGAAVGVPVRLLDGFSLSVPFWKISREALPYLSVTERDLPLLAIPGETEFFDRADTNAPEILHRIRDAVTDIAAKSQFPMFTANTVTL